MGKTTSIKKLLFGETDRFSRLLEPTAAQLINKYPNPSFAPLLTSLPYRSITVGPMAMCEKLAQDLGGSVDDSLLRALGIMCFHISTHDDLIDEPPASLRQKAALLYTGNISFIEGTRQLLECLPKEKVAFICAEIERNHYLQQQCVDTLWVDRPAKFADYVKGVQHDGALIGIGVSAALAATDREELWPQLEPMCTNYGIALQLLDDISEAEEDEAAGYNSYPVVEGVPYKTSFAEVDQHVTKAIQLLDPEWHNFRELLENVHAVKGTMQGAKSS